MLATAYGWSEADVLSLSITKINAYLKLIIRDQQKNADRMRNIRRRR